MQGTEQEPEPGTEFGSDLGAEPGTEQVTEQGAPEPGAELGEGTQAQFADLKVGQKVEVNIEGQFLSPTLHRARCRQFGF